MGLIPPEGDKKAASSGVTPRGQHMPPSPGELGGRTAEGCPHSWIAPLARGCAGHATPRVCVSEELGTTKVEGGEGREDVPSAVVSM